MSMLTIEMVDEVINRTNATYNEAKEALEATNGDILEAVVLIETSRGTYGRIGKDFTSRASELVDRVKELVVKGNVSSIVVEHNGRKLLDVPVTIGGIAALFLVWQTLFALIAAFGTGCVIKVIKENGEVINVNDFVFSQVDSVKERASNIKEMFSGSHQSTQSERRTDDDIVYNEVDEYADRISEVGDDEYNNDNH